MIVINTLIHYLQSADCSLYKPDNTFHWETLACYLNSTVWKRNATFMLCKCITLMLGGIFVSKYLSRYLCSSDIDSFSNMVTAFKSERIQGLQTDN